MVNPRDIAGNAEKEISSDIKVFQGLLTYALFSEADPLMETGEERGSGWHPSL